MCTQLLLCSKPCTTWQSMTTCFKQLHATLAKHHSGCSCTVLALAECLPQLAWGQRLYRHIQPMGSAPKCGNHPTVTLLTRKHHPPGCFSYPCPASILTGVSLRKRLSSITNIQALLGAPSLSEVPGWDCKVFLHTPTAEGTNTAFVLRTGHRSSNLSTKLLPDAL